MSEIFGVVGFAIAAAGLSVLIKQYKPEYAFAISVIFGVVILLIVFGDLTDIFEKIEGIFEKVGTDFDNYGIILKCFGICMISGVAHDACEDCGQASIAKKASFFGKIFVVITAFPLFDELVMLIEEIIEI